MAVWTCSGCCAAPSWYPASARPMPTDWRARAVAACSMKVSIP